MGRAFIESLAHNMILLGIVFVASYFSIMY
jgi:hypothetical protein